VKKYLTLHGLYIHCRDCGQAFELEMILNHLIGCQMFGTNADNMLDRCMDIMALYVPL
jgi:hypothetical protein